MMNHEACNMDKPRILIIGDSISIGYTEPVTRLLAQTADFFRPDENCASTIEGLEHIDRWLAPGPWNVIHFNWGLHDLKYITGTSDSLADPAVPESFQKVPPVAYKKNLTDLVSRLAETEATLVWCSTTPVPASAQGRIAGDAAAYNMIASEIMEQHKVTSPDLYSLALPRLKEIQQPVNVCTPVISDSDSGGKRTAA